MTWTKENAREFGRKGGLEKHKRRELAALNSPEVNRFTMAVQARWAAERGSEEEIREYFKKNVSIEAGLELLARMRENCKVASYELNARLTADSNKDRCLFCGGPKRPNRQWALVRPYRDPTTLLELNHFFCSIECVALMNRRDNGVYGVPDRGMLADHNPQNHPREFPSPESQPASEVPPPKNQEEGK